MTKAAPSRRTSTAALAPAHKRKRKRKELRDESREVACNATRMFTFWAAAKGTLSAVNRESKPGEIVIPCFRHHGKKSPNRQNKARARFQELTGGGAFRCSKMEDTATKLNARHLLRLLGYAHYKKKQALAFPALKELFAHLNPVRVVIGGDEFIQFTESADTPGARSMFSAIAAVDRAMLSPDVELWIVGLDVETPAWVSLTADIFTLSPSWWPV